MFNPFKNKAFRYLICGGITAAFNILLIEAIISVFAIETPLWENIANAVAIEISLIFSFFIYKLWVWSTDSWKLQEIILREIPKFHIAFGGVILARIFLIFPILNWLGVSAALNTLAGIILGAILNYTISDKWVFKSQNKSQDNQDESK